MPRTAATTSRARAALDREFAVLCFNWDGTVVADREADADGRAQPRGTARALGVDIAVVSGPDVATVDGQLRARPDVEGRLFLFLSRGSEVYVVGPNGPRLLERRQASGEEEAQLTAAAEALRDELAAAGLDVGRRVRSPQPAQGRPRRRAGGVAQVGRSGDAPPGRARLAKAGFKDVEAVVELARALAREAGLAHPGIASDGRHIEIGLTDKSDSMRYVLRWLIHERGREPADCSSSATSSGRSADGDGSDHLTLIPELRRSTFVSVGVEPDGVPPRVLHVGGGPEEFLASSTTSSRGARGSRRERSLQPTADPAWRFEVKGFDPFREREVETWLTVANGESGTRGALEEGSAVSTPATFVAGVFGDGTDEPRFRQPVPGAGLDRPAPARAGVGHLLPTASCSSTSACSTCATASSIGTGASAAQRPHARVRTARFASLADRQVLAIRAEATPEDFSGASMWDGAVGVTHAGGPTKETEFETLDEPGFIARTRGRNGGGHVLAVTTRPAPGSPVVRHMEQARDVIGGRLEPGDPATVDRLAAIVSARTRVPSSDSARRALARAEELGYRRAPPPSPRGLGRALARRRPGRQRRRRRPGGPALQHLPHDQHRPPDQGHGVGGRSRPGRHVLLPARLLGHARSSCCRSSSTRTRRRRARCWPIATATSTAPARRRATWGTGAPCTRGSRPTRASRRRRRTASGPDGEMVPILSGLMEHHISGDVAWGVWEYWKGTGDDAFMASMGVEIMLETARFWASRASLGEDGRYHIRLVVGPDEYHEGVDDNAYTNVLARWNIGKAVEALGWLDHVDSGYAEELRRGSTSTTASSTTGGRSPAPSSTASTPRRSSSSSSPASTRWTTCPSRSCARGRWPPT